MLVELIIYTSYCGTDAIIFMIMKRDSWEKNMMVCALPVTALSAEMRGDVLTHHPMLLCIS